jgi:hypothetical protein
MKNLFVVDAETDGLYGAVWAIGTVVLREDGSELDRFAGQVDPSDLTDSWVRENVAAHISLPRFATRQELRDAFWAFWTRHRESAMCVADVGSPVESGLFRTCVADDPASRMWNGPYPLHEVATVLLCAGVDPDVDRVAFSGLTGLTKHNPVDDSLASGHSWLKAMKFIKPA